LSGARVAVQELQVVGAQVARERARGVQLVRGSSIDGYEHMTADISVDITTDPPRPRP
jgi:hypothetical protein